MQTNSSLVTRNFMRISQTAAAESLLGGRDFFVFFFIFSFNCAISIAALVR